MKNSRQCPKCGATTLRGVSQKFETKICNKKSLGSYSEALLCLIVC